MYKKNNKHHLWLILFVVVTFYNYCVKEKTKDFLNQSLTFQVNGDFFQAFQQTCKEEKINLGILTNKQPAFVGNFYNKSLKDILSIILDESLTFDIKGSFLIIKDQTQYKKVYQLILTLNQDQKKSINKFLSDYISNINSQNKYIYNEEDGTIIYYGFKDDHIIINKYIEKINVLYNQQIKLECKIIAVSSNKNKNGMSVIDFIHNVIQNILYYEQQKNLSIIKKLHTTNFILEKDPMYALLKYLGDIYDIQHIQEIELLLANEQLAIFNTSDTRYLDNIYDNQIVPIGSNKNTQVTSILKNIKTLEVGIDLKIRAKIDRNTHVTLVIEYKQSSFRKSSFGSLPEINKNSFSTLINVDYNKITAINGLKTKIKSKRKRKKAKSWFWNFLFFKEDEEEIECEIIFLIRIIDVNKNKKGEKNND